MFDVIRFLKSHIPHEMFNLLCYVIRIRLIRIIYLGHENNKNGLEEKRSAIFFNALYSINYVSRLFCSVCYHLGNIDAYLC